MLTVLIENYFITSIFIVDISKDTKHRARVLCEQIMNIGVLIVCVNLSNNLQKIN